MKLIHIVKYDDVFFKFDNGLYQTMSSVVMALYENSPFEMMSPLLVEYFLSEFYETWSHCLVRLCFS